MFLPEVYSINCWYPCGEVEFAYIPWPGHRKVLWIRPATWCAFSRSSWFPVVVSLRSFRILKVFVLLLSRVSRPTSAHLSSYVFPPQSRDLAYGLHLYFFNRFPVLSSLSRGTGNHYPGQRGKFKMWPHVRNVQFFKNTFVNIVKNPWQFWWHLLTVVPIPFLTTVRISYSFYTDKVYTNILYTDSDLDPDPTYDVRYLLYM